MSKPPTAQPDFPYSQYGYGQDLAGFGQGFSDPSQQPPPMGAPQCRARGVPLQAEVALDAVRTTTYKDSTPTDASCRRLTDVRQLRPRIQTCELVTITNLAEISTRPWGRGDEKLLEVAVGVWTEVFKYISFSNPSAQ